MVFAMRSAVCLLLLLLLLVVARCRAPAGWGMKARRACAVCLRLWHCALLAQTSVAGEQLVGSAHDVLITQLHWTGAAHRRRCRPAWRGGVGSQSLEGAGCRVQKPAGDSGRGLRAHGQASMPGKLEASPRYEAPCPGIQEMKVTNSTPVMMEPCSPAAVSGPSLAPRLVGCNAAGRPHQSGPETAVHLSAAIHCPETPAGPDNSQLVPGCLPHAKAKEAA